MPLAEIAVNLAFLTVTTRVLFAQAFDRLLPVRVAKVGERNHAPNVAIAIVLIVGVGFCYLTSFVNLSNIVALQSLFLALILPAGRPGGRRPEAAGEAAAGSACEVEGRPT